MKFIITVVLASLLAACHFNAGSEHTLGGHIQKPRFVPPALKVPQPTRLKKFVDAQVAFSYESTLISHGQFIFLEECRPGITIRKYQDKAGSYFPAPGTTEVFPVELADAIRFDEIKGHTILVNFPDHTQQRVKIKEIVIIREGNDAAPYFAGVIDLPEDQAGKGLWATTKSRLNPFPFVEVQEELIRAIALVHFDSLAEFHHFKENLEPGLPTAFIEHPGKVRIFEARKNEKYVFVQHSWHHLNGDFLQSYSALYHVTPSGWALDVEGPLDLELTDFIDTDADFYPELLMANPSGTVIYEINFAGFDPKESLWWSPYRGMVEGCGG